MTAPIDLAFLARAIAGRSLPIDRSGVRSARPFCDGQAIFVADDDFDWRSIAAQSALVGAESLDPIVLRRLVGKPVATARYAYLEILRGFWVLRDRLPLALTDEGAVADPLTDSPRQSLDVALGSTDLPDAPRWFGQIRPLATLRRSVGSEGLSALTRRNATGDLTTKDIPQFGEGDKTEESAILKLFQNPFSKGNPIGDVLNQILGAGFTKLPREADADGQGGAEMPIGRIEQTLRRGVTAMFARLPSALPDTDSAAHSDLLSYPEWDAHANAYRRNWVTVEVVDPCRERCVDSLDLVLGEPSITLRRQLATLGLDHEPHVRQSDGADLDTAALIDAAIELRTGHSPLSLNVYRTSRRTRRDLAVVIVLDISGSTGDAAADSVFAKQLRLGFQLARALDMLGDTVAMFGFHGWGRQRVRAVRLKGAGERWTGAIAERMRLLEPVGYTRTGAAIRHGTHMLTTGIWLPHRLLVLITDGIAYDQDYEHGYAQGDTRKAIEEAQAKGTGCICLSVGAGNDATKLRDSFGPGNILAVDEVDEVIGQIRSICRMALAAVTRRKLRAA